MSAVLKISFPIIRSFPGFSTLSGMPRFSFLTALLASLLLHLSLLAGGMLRNTATLTQSSVVADTRLDARLLPAPPSTSEPTPPAEPVEALLKNTLAEASPAFPKPATKPPASSKLPGPSTPPVSAAQETAQRKLATHVYYPAEAVALGMEGEVRLLLTLDPDGRILDAVVAASSGHALLDQAALDAVRAMARLPDSGVRELILPVTFRLQ
jgi:protein TonB